MLILTLKNIRIRDRYQLFKKLLLNFFLPPKTNLETNFTKFLKRDKPFYPQLTWRKQSAREIQNAALYATVSIYMHKEISKW